MDKAVKRTEKGWPGHFICANMCVFRRHTMLEFNEVAIAISSVGNMMNWRDHDKIEMIGARRYFETMSFHCKPVTEEEPWRDADVSRQIDFNSPWSIDAPWREQEANDMHEAVVAEITAELLNGNKYELD